MNTKANLQDIVAAHRLVGFDDFYWNLGQVVAWAETRSPFPVDALSDATNEQARRDHSMTPEQPHFAAEFAEKCADESGLPRSAMPFNSSEDARVAVLKSLQAGSVVASGRRGTSSAREPIPALEWADLTIADTNIGEMIVRRRESQDVAWHDVRAPRDEVLQYFPEDEGQRSADHLDGSEGNQTPASVRPEDEQLPVRPPEGAFDPDKLSHWSITMTMAWIMWGDLGAVREEWDDYRSQCAEWRFFSDVSLDAQELEDSIRNATLDEPAPNDPEVSVRGKWSGTWKFAAWAPSGWLGVEFKARRDDIPWERMIDTLWLAAGEGRLVATALECPLGAADGRMVEIPAHLWPRLNRKRERSGKAMLAGPDRDYRDVRFSRLDVKRLWPLREVTPVAQDDERHQAPNTTIKRRTSNAKGRPKEYKWDTEIKDFAMGLVKQYGPPGEGNPKLPRQEDLVLAIQNELAKKDLHPGASSVRRYVSRWLAEL